MTGNNRSIAYVAGAILIGGVGAAIVSSQSNSNGADAPPAQTEAPSQTPERQSNADIADTSADDIVTVQSTDSSGPIRHDSDDLAFTATFPEASNMRRVANALRAETRTYLDRARSEARSSGADSSMPQWEIKIDWDVVATTDGFASLVGKSYEYRGGAHPVELVDTKLMQTDTGEEIPQSRLFNSRTWPTPAVAIAVCENLKAAKTQTVGAQTIFDEPIVCAGPNNNIKLEDAKLAFAASKSGAGFGGLHVFYQPYVVGSYAEGSYEFTIPAEVFIEDVAKDYRQLFTGDPVPLVD